MLEADNLGKDLTRLSLSDEGPPQFSSEFSNNEKKLGVILRDDEQVIRAGGSNIVFVDYRDESQLSDVMSLVGRDLSEPYSIFTYRYFLYRFPELCILAVDEDTRETIGCVVAKIDIEKVAHPPFDSNAPPSSTDFGRLMTGYIGMLAVSQSYRRRGIGKALVEKVIQRMKDCGCTSVMLETEVTNLTAQRLYEDIFGFVREELLVRYYLNWNDAYRLRLCFSDDE